MRKPLYWLLVLSLFATPAFSLTTPHHRRKPREPKWWERRVFVPSHESLLEQNSVIDRERLERVKNDSVLKELVKSDELVPITDNQYVRISPRLEAKRRYCRPEVDAFLQELGGEYYTEFGEPIQVNSAIRTEKTQSWLRRWNRNAAPVHGETASAHLAGIAVDLQRRGLTLPQVRFIQRKLLELAKWKMVIVEEELREPCFHVVVTDEYPVPPPMNLVIPLNPNQEILNGILNPNRN
jgi:hypothetical protein